MEKMEYKRKLAENLKEYKIRLAKNKEQYNLSWNQIADLINQESGDNYNESTYRKWSTAFLEGLNYRGDLDVNDEIAEIEDKIVELKKQEVKFRDQKRDYNKVLREFARMENLKDYIKEVALEVGENKPLLLEVRRDVSDSTREGELMLSDWHSGMECDNHWNTFNSEIMKQRVSRLIDKTITYGLENKVKRINVMLLGDFISGVIRTTVRLENNENVIEQIMLVAEILSESLIRLARHFEIRVYNAVGNHSRVSANINESNPTENFEYLLPWYLQARLSHLRETIQFVENEIDEEISILEVCDKYKLVGVHGNRDKVTDVAQNLSLMIRENIDYVLMGHLHHNASSEVNGVEIIQNGGLVGVDTYAKSIRKTSKPSQKFLVFDGVESLMATYSVRLDVDNNDN